MKLQEHWDYCSICIISWKNRWWNLNDTYSVLWSLKFLNESVTILSYFVLEMILVLLQSCQLNASSSICYRTVHTALPRAVPFAILILLQVTAHYFVRGCTLLSLTAHYFAHGITLLSLSWHRNVHTLLPRAVPCYKKLHTTLPKAVHCYFYLVTICLSGQYLPMAADLLS